MKKILSFLAAFVIVTSSFAQKEIIGLHLAKDSVYLQKIISNVIITQLVNGQQIKVDLTIDGSMKYKVIDINHSDYDMEVWYEHLSMKMELPGNTMEFSSEKNDVSDIFSTILGEMKNRPFLITMTSTGKVKEVKNIDTLFSNVFNAFPQIDENQQKQVLDQVKQAYGEKAFKGNLEMSMAIFSDEPVATGDQWTINTRIEAGMAASMQTVYELKEVNDQYYLIQGNSTIETADKDAYVEANGMPLKYDLAGTMLSNIKVHKSNGWIIHTTISQQLKGTAYIKENPQMPDGMAIPMTMENEMTITE